MKKRLLAIVAFLVALVMSFALIACGDKTGNSGNGGGNGGGGDDTSTTQLTSAKLKTAIDKLANAKTLELEIAGSFNSKNTEEAEDIALTAVVSDNKVKLVEDENAIHWDLATGYAYSLDEDGKCYYYQQMFPNGMVSYVGDVFADAFGGADVDATALYDEIVKQFSYDETYGGFVAKLDEKDHINAALKFVQDAYADDLTLNEVADQLLKKITGEENITLEALLELVSSENGYGLVKNMTLASLLGENADDIFAELFASLEEAGLELTTAQKTAIKNRKIGEIAAGVMAVLPGIMENGLEELDPEVVIDAVLFDSYTAKQIDDVAESLSALSAQLIGFLKEAKVRAFIDEAPAEIKAIVKNKVQFVKLTADFGIKLDDNGNITEFKFDGYVEHNYTGEIAGFVFLSDNKYDLSVTVGIATKNTVTEIKTDGFDFDEEVYFRDHINVIVKAYDDADAKVYFETMGKDVTVSDIKVVYYDYYDEYKWIEIEDVTVTFNDATSSFVIPATSFETLVEYAAEYEVEVWFTVDDGEEENDDFRLYLIVMADKDPTTLGMMIGSSF